MLMWLGVRVVLDICYIVRAKGLSFFFFPFVIGFPKELLN